MNRRYFGLAALSVCLLLWGVAPAAGINDYIRSVKQRATVPLVMAKAGQAVGAVYRLDGKAEESGWLERIRKEAPNRRIEPVDARMDRVWKAVPGYNGREVDVDKTLALAKTRKPGSDIPFVYREIPPAVGLEQLGPQPIYKGNPNKPMVSLMINVAWGNEYILPMLETLNKENVHATFFFDGSWLKNNLSLAREIGSYGHELSNHAYSHKNMSQLGRSQAVQEIAKTQKLLEEQLGVKNKLFAPPSGDYDEETVQIAHEMKLKTVLWTIDTVDWQKPPSETVIRRVHSRLEPGAMILMHPTAASRDALPSIIKEVKRRGWTLGTVSELIAPARVPSTESSVIFGQP